MRMIEGIWYSSTTYRAREVHDLIKHNVHVLVAMHMLHIIYRSLWSMRNYIHVMLCANLFVAQLVFMIGIDKVGNEVREEFC